jgi:hypothetical protein
MLKIGMDRTDRNFRKFEYDDERRYGNPPAQMFKVLYEETGVFGEVLCSNVITIKKSNNVKNHFLDIPKYGEVKIDETFKSELTSDVHKTIDEVMESEPVVVTVETKKQKSTRTKAKLKDEPLTGKAVKVKDVSLGLDLKSVLPKSYEYDILVIDNISNTEDIKSKLNEFGKDGWEVCGFQIIQKLFGSGSQAVIIMKKGLI